MKGFIAYIVYYSFLVWLKSEQQSKKKINTSTYNLGLKMNKAPTYIRTCGYSLPFNSKSCSRISLIAQRTKTSTVLDKNC